MKTQKQNPPNFIGSNTKYGAYATHKMYHKLQWQSYILGQEDVCSRGEIDVCSDCTL
jgi:hypothetical protein